MSRLRAWVIAGGIVMGLALFIAAPILLAIAMVLAGAWLFASPEKIPDHVVALEKRTLIACAAAGWLVLAGFVFGTAVATDEQIGRLKEELRIARR